MSSSSPSSHSSELSPTDQVKRRAAFKAVEDHFDPSARYVGIGSGTTVIFVVEAIGARIREAAGPCNTTFIPTGYQSRDLIVQAGLRLGTIDSLSADVMLDVSFDGADELDHELNCIKGGGACLLQEKLVAVNSRKFICVADHRKLQPRLLTQWRTVPIEVVPLAASTVLRSLHELGSPNPTVRSGGSAKAGPVVTDNGNFIIDAPFPHPLMTSKNRYDGLELYGAGDGDGVGGWWFVDKLAQRLKDLVGVVETGLFWGINGYQLQSLWHQQPSADPGARPVRARAQKPVAAYLGMENGRVLVRDAEGGEKIFDGGGKEG
ncbi:MAG: ribose-5-phosphate isomerase rki1 [Peltula sp. TS41687]|nr:MAG: ribose-5-phosphate isomerase rki1 [Peltula sp. TS41687]